MGGLDGFAITFLNGKVMAEWLPKIVEGFALTVALAALIVVAGLALGLGLAVLRAFGLRVLNWAIIFFVDLFRALPPLVIIVLLYFGLPGMGISLSGFWATWLSLTLVLAAFSEEIFWAGITATPRGQWDAGKALGLRFLPILFRIVLPQAVRMVVPPLTNRTIAITKGTALASVVGVAEILGAAQSAMAFSGNPSPLTLGAIAYALLFLPVVGAGRWIERRVAIPGR
ncbi:polar amino acid transport system permease protein [Roseomonas rosea]|uniref:Polar amino acid transport system permease protein n=1 Tax=Muricoccus roseus TaxID=198092 RepID=A0A1M6KUT3_9PROT|nr:amino acid ABC transporter permease [Roseomonas rosea]SHJ62693.1 polar amino acid transport system permease protein [Roseomonas rosea]